jgi:hypothetical protein
MLSWKRFCGLIINRIQEILVPCRRDSRKVRKVVHEEFRYESLYLYNTLQVTLFLCTNVLFCMSTGTVNFRKPLEVRVKPVLSTRRYSPFYQSSYKHIVQNQHCFVLLCMVGWEPGPWNQYFCGMRAKLFLH